MLPSIASAVLETRISRILRLLLPVLRVVDPELIGAGLCPERPNHVATNGRTHKASIANVAVAIECGKRVDLAICPPIHTVTPGPSHSRRVRAARGESSPCRRTSVAIRCYANRSGRNLAATCIRHATRAANRRDPQCRRKVCARLITKSIRGKALSFTAGSKLAVWVTLMPLGRPLASNGVALPTE